MTTNRLAPLFAIGLFASLFAVGQLGCPETDDDDDNDTDQSDDDATGDDDDDATGDDDTGGDPATVEDICATVFDCFDNNWGWSSEGECVDLWLTGCADEAGYLICAADCLTGDCADFAAVDGTSGCEPDCWSGYCG